MTCTCTLAHALLHAALAERLQCIVHGHMSNVQPARPRDADTVKACPRLTLTRQPISGRRTYACMCGSASAGVPT
eukprot:scaffold30832_cov67-Phaeocystis_antarctica.AAC.6